MSDTMREKLIELLSVVTCPNEICNFCEHFENGVACERHRNEVIADLIIANGVTVQQWIPASEPPKDCGEYIVLIKGAKRPTTLWYHPMRETWEACGGLAPYPVTRWMPLPKPPKGE